MCECLFWGDWLEEREYNGVNWIGIGVYGYLDLKGVFNFLFMKLLG